MLPFAKLAKHCLAEPKRDTQKCVRDKMKQNWEFSTEKLLRGYLETVGNQLFLEFLFASS